LTALHGGQPVLETGEPLEQATAAMILLHGRGASAADIMTVGEAVRQPGFAYLAPQAAGSAWYPNPFTAPLQSNEPWLSSALEAVERLLERVEERLPGSQVILLGFSQGACLALEFAGRHARRYGGVVGLSGALIGPDDAPRDYPGSLAGTPVLLGCSDADPYVSAGRVRESGEILRRLGGEVEVRIYPDLGHEVNDDEIDEIREMMSALVRRGQAGGRPSR
jgi:phospholipase/carboxylesterase